MNSATPHQPQRDDSVRRSAETAGGEVVLIAEDDDDLRDFLCRLLELDGYQVVAAADGAEAMKYIDDALLNSYPTLPSVVVTDIRMPKHSGFDLLAYTGFVPAIVMTAFGDAATHRRARALGARFVFDKPCDSDALRTAVRKLARESSRA